jgi:glycosyltransferase involved in cell wall biosynthesis
MTRPRVAAIVPAYNEAGRISAVLDVISRARSVDEILVVTDGCTDGTNDEVTAWLAGREAVERPVARLFALTQNIGKGGAMTYGAHRTDADVLLFLDADLIGLRPEQVDELLQPTLMEDNPADMALGLFGSVRGGILGWWLGFCHRFTPSITGQRAIRRDLFLEVPGLTHSRYGVEAAITRFVTSDPTLRTDYVYLHSVTHPIKEEKQGAWKGFRNRMRMYTEIGSYLIGDSCQRQTNQIRARYREGALRLRERLGSK